LHQILVDPSVGKPQDPLHPGVRADAGGIGPGAFHQPRQFFKQSCVANHVVKDETSNQEDTEKRNP
jgi:hypothetical protein